VLLAVALLALGFGVGLYAGDHSGSEDTASTAPREPAAAVGAETTAPSEAGAVGDSTTDGSEVDVEERRPAFSVAPLPRSVRAQLRARRFWRPGCPVSLSGLRLLTIAHRGFDGQVHSGQLVVNRRAAHPLKRVFRELHRIRFPIRHAGFADFYGPRRERPREGDVTASFECRQSVPSPCTGGTRSGNWSNHAYGLAIDINPTENPYIGCGQSRDPATRPYRDRSRHRRGMVSPRVVAAFRSIGWGWGGAWTGDTKDYMHFSPTGR
jgi:hypothetical protein